MGPLGFEPRTSRLSAVRSNQAEPRAPYLIHVYFIFKIAFIVVQMLDQFSLYLYLYFQGKQALSKTWGVGLSKTFFWFRISFLMFIRDIAAFFNFHYLFNTSRVVFFGIGFSNLFGGSFDILHLTGTRSMFGSKALMNPR